MSEEEKEAIIRIKNVIEYDKEHRIVTIYDEQPLLRDRLQIILNLVEKQQKEIEKLEDIVSAYNVFISEDFPPNELMIVTTYKNFNKLSISDEFISKAKIKAKMKEKEWSLENYDCDESDYKQSQAIGAWSVLQDLLEKE